MKKYLFKKRNPLFGVIFIALVFLSLSYLTRGGKILYIGLFLFLAHEFFLIEEIQVSENQIAIKNAFKQVFHFTYDEICVFGKGWGNSIFYIYGVKKRCIPFLFQSLGELPEEVPEMLVSCLINKFTQFRHSHESGNPEKTRTGFRIKCGMTIKNM